MITQKCGMEWLVGVGGVAILGGENVFCLSGVADHQCTATGSMLCGLLAETTVLICAANHKDIQECYESVVFSF